MSFSPALAGVLLFLTPVAADEGMLAEMKDFIAAELSYPAARLTIEDTTERAAKHGKIKVLRWWSIVSNDHTFANLDVAVCPRGMLLTSEMEKAYAKAAVEAESNRIRRVSLGSDAYGYTGGGGFGAGGSEVPIMGTWPSHGIDIMIRTFLPGDSPLDYDDKTAKYHELVTNGGNALEGKLAGILGFVMEHAAELHLDASAEPKNGSGKVSPNEVRENERRRESKPKEANEVTSLEWWLWFSGLILLGICVWIILRCRAQKR